MNKCFLIGNLTKDPEVFTTASGVNVCKFGLAVARKFENTNGEKETDFFNIVAWRAIGDVCHKYLHKGSKVAVVGSINNRSYDAQDGTKRTVTEIIVEDVEFLTPKNSEKSDDGIELTATEDYPPLPF